VAGTTSHLKLSAVHETWPEYTVLGTQDFVSAVREQPVGREETLLGARHRANKAFEHIPRPHFAIGIENGMIKEEGKWFDIGAIIILGENLDVTIWSDALAIPQENLDACLDENGNPFQVWSEWKDPHIGICGKSRKEFLSDAMNAWRQENSKFRPLK